MSEGQYFYGDYGDQSSMEGYADPSTPHWTDYNTFLDDNSPIGAVAFDDQHELLWTGSQNGRLTSFLHNGGADFQKYCSVLAHTSSIVQILNLPRHILSVSENTVRFHSRGGLLNYSFQPSMADYQTGNSLNLTCGAIFEPSGGLMRGASENYLFLGSSGRVAQAYDLNVPDMPVVSYDVVSPTLRAQSSITFLTVGCSDGKVRLLDPSLRSNTVQHTLDAHSGGITSVSVTWDGMTMISSGYVGRAINPFDPNSPRTLHPDPLVKVFDMRMLRQRAPLSLAIPPANNAIFLQQQSSSTDSGVSILCSSPNGYLQSIHLDQNLEPVMESLQMFYATLATSPQDHALNPQAPQDSLCVVATCGSGQLIASGSLMGAVSLHCSAIPDEEGNVHVSINEQSIPLVIPPTRPPAPAASPAIDTPNLASTFVLSKKRPTPFESRVMLSAFNSTPRLLAGQLKFHSMQKILPSLLKEAVFQDYIGSIKNTHGFPVNSMLCRKLRGQAYDICDPRVSEKSHDMHHQQHATQSPTIRKYSVGSASSNDSDHLSRLSRPTAEDAHNPPPVYRKVRSHRGKHRMQIFNYSAFNSTPFVGLENSTPNCWVNPILQVLFAVPSIRNSALATQLSPFHHTRPNTLFAELGFLFDLMLSIQQAGEQVATPSNFHRVLKTSSEAVAVGLFDTSKLESSVATLSEGTAVDRPAAAAVSGNDQMCARSLQSLVQVFCRFLLHQLSAEHVQEIRSLAKDDGDRGPDPVENTFSFDADTTVVFRQSGSIAPDTVHKALTLELSYPVHNNPTPPCFAEVLFCSLTKTTATRGWCAASDSYEPFQQTRRLRPASIHQIFTILCGETVPVPASPSKPSARCWTAESLWRSKNPFGGSWLPVQVEILFIPTAGASSAKGGAYFVSEKHISSPDVGTALGMLSETEETEAEITASGGTKEVWVIFDGTNRIASHCPASVLHLNNCTEEIATSASVTSLKLFAVVSGVKCDTGGDASAKEGYSPVTNEQGNTCHAVLHMRTGEITSSSSPPASRKDSRSSSIDTDAASDAAALLEELIDRVAIGETRGLVEDEWTLFNDFAVSKSSEQEATTFAPWRVPCVLFFTRCDRSPMWPDNSLYESLRTTQRVAVPVSVLGLHSLSSVSSVQPPASFLRQQLSFKETRDCAPCHIAFDAEFVSVEVENVIMDTSGQRIVHDEGRQVVGRVSLLDGRRKVKPSSSGGIPSKPQLEGDEQILLLDDYIRPTEPVVDYVTRFSGLVEEDLNPATSRHAVVADRTAYLKLRYYLDSGCVFVGHGLQKDFETANIFVPPEQVRDTVELWRLPNMRKISLRFLASYLLHMEIQDDIHDSIEDAKTALLLYWHYEDTKAMGATQLQATLNELYSFGSRTNWTIGLDRINVSPTPISRKDFRTRPQGDAGPTSSAPPHPASHHYRSGAHLPTEASFTSRHHDQIGLQPHQHRHNHGYSGYSQHHGATMASHPTNMGRGRGDVYMRDRPGHGRGEYSPGRGEYGHGRGEYSPGRGDYGHGRGEYSRGRGEYGLNRGDGYGPPRGDVFAGRGDVYGPGRGRGGGRGYPMPGNHSQYGGGGQQYY